MFFIIAVGAAICLIAGFVVLPKNKAQEISNKNLDKASLILSFLGFGITLYALSAIGTKEFSALNLFLSVVGIVFIILFIIRQTKSKNHLLKFKVFNNRIFRITTILFIVVNASGMCNAIFIPILVQSLCGHSAAISGLVLTPGAILSVIINPFIGKYFDKHGPRMLCTVGGLLVALTSFMISFSYQDMSMIFLAIILTVRSVVLLMFIRSAPT